MMKRIMFLLIAIGLTISTTTMAAMSTSKVREESRFLTDKMVYELNLNTAQYDDIYEINYDFLNSVRNIMDYVVRGEEWAMDDYYEALDVRNDDLRWILNNVQYNRLMGLDYFYRPIYVNRGAWSFRIYVNYPNRRSFYFGVPYHYRTYCGAHYRPHYHHASFYRGRYPHGGHYPVPHRMRDERVSHSYRRSDFGSVHFRPNTSARPNYAPTRPSVRPDRPGTGRPESNRPITLPETEHRPSSPDRPSRPSDRPSSNSRPSSSSRPSNGSSRSERGHVSTGSSERRSSSENSRRNRSSGSSSRSSERGNSSRR